jgi:hypothetical protein
MVKTKKLSSLKSDFLLLVQILFHLTDEKRDHAYTMTGYEA